MGAAGSVGSGGMSRVKLYLDEDAMRKALLFGLRTKWVDVVTALEAGLVNQPDAEHLRWATGRVGCCIATTRGTITNSITLFWPGGKGRAGLWWRASRLIRWGKRFDGCCG